MSTIVSQQMTRKDHWLEAERLLQWIADNSSGGDMERQCVGTEALVHAVLASSSVKLA